jgi:hypothetical protein
VAEGLSSLNLHEKRTILNRISKPCKGKPNSHAWNIQRSFRSNRFSHIPGYGSGPPQATAGPYAHQLCRTYVCSATIWSRIPVCLAEHTPTRLCVCTIETKIIEWWRHVHLPGHSGTRLTAYHISRHVASTFKRLATTTTHCDLSNFYQHRRGKLPGYVIAHDSVHDPYSNCRIVNIQFLYSASDRKSLDFYRSY